MTMAEDDLTTTLIRKKDVERLEKIKEHPRVPNAEVIARLIDFFERYSGVVERER